MRCGQSKTDGKIRFIINSGYLKKNQTQNNYSTLLMLTIKRDAKTEECAPIRWRWWFDFKATHRRIFIFKIASSVQIFNWSILLACPYTHMRTSTHARVHNIIVIVATVTSGTKQRNQRHINLRDFFFSSSLLPVDSAYEFCHRQFYLRDP